MVEAPSRERRIHDATFGIDQRQVSLDSDFVKHSDEQGSFVLAIPIAVGEGISGHVRLNATNSYGDFNITNVVLSIAGDGVNLGNGFLFDSGQLRNFLLHLWRSDSTPYIK